MKSNPIKSPCRKAALVAALCALSASSALAAFSVTRGPYWPGETDYYYGNTRISDSGTINNSGSLIYNSSSLPPNNGTIEQGIYRSGDFYWGIGLLDWGADGATVNNTGTIQAVVTGTGEAQAEGILSLQSLTVNNWGLIDAQLRNHDGSVDGICAQGSRGLTVYNHAGATISASGPFWADAIDAANYTRIINDGTITATAYAGTQHGTGNLYDSFGKCAVAGISTGGGNPGDTAYFENNGTLSVYIPDTAATVFARAQAFTCWFGIPVVWKNTGTVSAQSDSPIGGAETFYYGAQDQPMSIFNSGTISASGVSSTALWMENDGSTGDMHIHNTGTISVSGPNPGFVILTAGWGPPNNIHVWFTNSGTLSGGMLVLGFPATVYESGQVHTTSYGVGNGSDVHITGLPTIDPVMDGGGSGSTLNFNLTGTLEQINGQSANGATSFSGLSGSSGSIVVSGKTYRWSNFANGVSGTCGSTPPPSGVTFYQDYNYGGSASQALRAGSYTTAQLAAKGMPNDWASSVKVPSGYTVILYAGDNFSGTSWTLTADQSEFGSLGANDQVSSVVVQGGITGTYKLVARHSGKALDAYGAQTANGTQIIQWGYGGGANQKWTISDDGGAYKIIGVQSGKCVDINGLGTANGTKVQLWDYVGGSNQKFSITATDSGYYRITPTHATGSCLDVEGVSTADGANVHLWQWLGGSNQQWAPQAP